MFRGIHAVNMDAKGRLAIPARFRELLAAACNGQIVVTIDPNSPNLALYPIAAWDEIQSQISALPTLNPQAKRLKQLFIGHAFDMEIDANGRVLVPPFLRKYAELEKKLVLLGQDQKIEIWAEEKWDARFEEIQSMTDGVEELPPEMQTLSY